MTDISACGRVILHFPRWTDRVIVTFSTKRFVLSWRERLDRLSYANNSSGKRRHCSFHSKYHLQLFLEKLRSNFVSLRLRQIRANHSNNVLKRSPWYSEIFLSPIFPELISRPCSHTSGMYYVVKSSVVASTSSGVVTSTAYEILTLLFARKQSPRKLPLALYFLKCGMVLFPDQWVISSVARADRLTWVIQASVNNLPIYQGLGDSLVLHCAFLLRTIFASSARAHERARVQNIRDFPQTKLDSEIKALFLLRTFAPIATAHL